jgi:biotin carboxyl carrier protein
MRFEIELGHGGKRSEHILELEVSGSNSPNSKMSLALDGRSLIAEPAEIAPGVYSILIGGRSYAAEVEPASSGADPTFTVRVEAKTFEIQVRDPRRRRRHEAAREHEGPQEIAAPMPGRIVKVLVAEEQEVRADDGLVIIEAMKMQNELRSPRAGRVEKIYVQAGAGVESGAKLVRLA